MIRDALQRPGRLRMRLTVVAAASALFALVVLAALVLPSLQRNLEQSRVASLQTSVRAGHPELFLRPFGQGQLTTARPAAPPGDARVWRGSRSSPRAGVSSCTGWRDSSPDAGLARKALELVEESASLHRDAADRRDLARRGRTAVLTFNVSSQGVDGVVLVQAPLRDIQQQVYAVERRLVFGGALAFGVALLAGALAAEPLARRLARLRAAADRIAHGSFERADRRQQAGRDRRAGPLAGRDAGATRRAGPRTRRRSSRMPRTSCARRSRRSADTSSCSPRAA